MFKLVNQCNKPLNRDLFITVAGNVGAGKSTLTKLVAERLGFEAHYEKVDGNPYLEDFYKDQEKWGFHLQLYFLAQRFKQQKEIDSNGLNNIQDRSIYEDVEIFARNLYDNEKMTKRDYITYRDLFKAISNKLEIIALAAIGLRVNLRELIKQGKSVSLYALFVGSLQVVTAIALISIFL